MRKFEGIVDKQELKHPSTEFWDSDLHVYISAKWVRVNKSKLFLQQNWFLLAEKIHLFLVKLLVSQVSIGLAH